MENNKLIAKNLIGRSYWQAPIIAARVSCGDSVAHNLAATKAIESACGIEVSSQTKKLCKLMLAAEIIKNHTNNLYFGVLPEFLGLNSAGELSKMHPEIFTDATNLIKFANEILETIGGRSIHPITSVVGGFKSYPQKSKLKNILENSRQVVEATLKTLRLSASLNLPKTEPISDFAALHENNEYAFYDGEIWTGKGKLYTSDKFSSLVESNNKNIVVGPLARYNLSRSHFDPSIKKVMEELAIAKKMSFLSDAILAKAIENYYFVILSIKILSDFAKDGVVREHILPPRKFSFGVSACESADGTVIHSCELDGDGIILEYEINILNES